MEINLGAYTRDGKQLPFYATNGSYCFDIRVSHYVHIDHMHRVVMAGTGLIFDIPDGYGLTMHPRSGLATKHGIGLANMTGIIDADYTDEVMIPLVWHAEGTKYDESDDSIIYLPDGSMRIARGTRVAQVALVKRIDHGFISLKEPPNPKGNRTGGLGSTGTK